MKKLAVVLISCALSACQGAGPRTSAILNDPNAVRIEAEQAEPFVLVEVNRAIAQKVADQAVVTKKVNFIPNGSAGPIIIGAGDVLDIAIVSTNEGGFIDFAQSSVSPVSTASLPSQQVGTDGNVNVPPIGRVNARGQSVQQFERFLERRLSEVLIDPSVIVNLTDRKSARVSVLGDINEPGAYSINQDSTHLIDVITLAGGPTGRPEFLNVKVNRGGSEGHISADQLLANPKYNIHLEPGDVITIEGSRRRFTLLGAGAQNASIDFNDQRLSLAEVLGRSGGLLNRRADRKGVFVFRETSPAVVQSLGASIERFGAGDIPTIFQFDLTAPTSIFTLAKFQIENGDIVYISDSPNEEVNAAIGAITAFVPAPVEYVRAETIN